MIIEICGYPGTLEFVKRIPDCQVIDTDGSFAGFECIRCCSVYELIAALQVYQSQSSILCVSNVSSLLRPISNSETILCKILCLLLKLSQDFKIILLNQFTFSVHTKSFIPSKSILY